MASIKIGIDKVIKAADNSIKFRVACIGAFIRIRAIAG